MRGKSIVAVILFVMLSVITINLGFQWNDPVPESQTMFKWLTSASAQEQRTVDWERGGVQAVGRAAAPDWAKNPAQAQIMALEGAKVMAYKALADFIAGVRVAGGTTVQKAVTQDQEAATAVQGVIKGARVVKEEVVDVSGAVMGVVTLEIPLRGDSGLAGQIPASWRSEEPKKEPQPAQPPSLPKSEVQPASTGTPSSIASSTLPESTRQPASATPSPSPEPSGTPTPSSVASSASPALSSQPSGASPSPAPASPPAPATPTPAPAPTGQPASAVSSASLAQPGQPTPAPMSPSPVPSGPSAPAPPSPSATSPSQLASPASSTSPAPLSQPESASASASPSPSPAPAIDGLILDARGLSGFPSLYPQVLTEEGKAVYGWDGVDREYLDRVGRVTNSIEKARDLLGKHGVTNPLVVKVSRIAGHTNYVIPAEEAKKVLSADNDTKFLRKSFVIFVLNL